MKLKKKTVTILILIIITTSGFLVVIDVEGITTPTWSVTAVAPADNGDESAQTFTATVDVLNNDAGSVTFAAVATLYVDGVSTGETDTDGSTITSGNSDSYSVSISYHIWNEDGFGEHTWYISVVITDSLLSYSDTKTSTTRDVNIVAYVSFDTSSCILSNPIENEIFPYPHTSETFTATIKPYVIASSTVTHDLTFSYELKIDGVVKDSGAHTVGENAQENKDGYLSVYGTESTSSVIDISTYSVGSHTATLRLYNIQVTKTGVDTVTHSNFTDTNTWHRDNAPPSNSPSISWTNPTDNWETYDYNAYGSSYSVCATLIDDDSDVSTMSLYVNDVLNKTWINPASGSSGTNHSKVITIDTDQIWNLTLYAIDSQSNTITSTRWLHSGNNLNLTIHSTPSSEYISKAPYLEIGSYDINDLHNLTILLNGYEAFSHNVTYSLTNETIDTTFNQSAASTSTCLIYDVEVVFGTIYEIDATWWNSSWDYRNNVTITMSGADTNYVFSLEFNSSFIDYTDCLANGADLRVTDVAGTELDFFIESWDNASGYSKIWINATSLNSGSNTISFYYGNTGASTASSFTDVLYLWDDFEDNDVTDWSANDDVAASTTEAYQGTYSLYKCDNQAGATYEDSAAWIEIATGTDDIFVDFHLYMDLLFDNDTYMEYVFVEIICYDSSDVFQWGINYRYGLSDSNNHYGTQRTIQGVAHNDPTTDWVFINAGTYVSLGGFDNVVPIQDQWLNETLDISTDKESFNCSSTDYLVFELAVCGRDEVNQVINKAYLDNLLVRPKNSESHTESKDNQEKSQIVSSETPTFVNSSTPSGLSELFWLNITSTQYLLMNANITFSYYIVGYLVYNNSASTSRIDYWQMDSTTWNYFSDGVVWLNLTLFDDLGNEMTLNSFFIKDTTAPSVILYSPENRTAADPYSNLEIIPFSYTITDANMAYFTNDDKTLTIDGETMDVADYPKHKPLQFWEGWHTLTITGTDIAGNSKSTTAIFYYEERIWKELAFAFTSSVDNQVIDAEQYLKIYIDGQLVQPSTSTNLNNFNISVYDHFGQLLYNYTDYSYNAIISIQVPLRLVSFYNPNNVLCEYVLALGVYQKAFWIGNLSTITYYMFDNNYTVIAIPSDIDYSTGYEYITTSLVFEVAAGMGTISVTLSTQQIQIIYLPISFTFTSSVDGVTIDADDYLKIYMDGILVEAFTETAKTSYVLRIDDVFGNMLLNSTRAYASTNNIALPMRPFTFVNKQLAAIKLEIYQETGSELYKSLGSSSTAIVYLADDSYSVTAYPKTINEDDDTIYLTTDFDFISSAASRSLDIWLDTKDDPYFNFVFDWDTQNQALGRIFDFIAIAAILIGMILVLVVVSFIIRRKNKVEQDEEDEQTETKIDKIIRDIDDIKGILSRDDMNILIEKQRKKASKLVTDSEY